MSCDGATYPAEIQALFAGGLDERRKERLRAHLPGCPSCRELFDRLAHRQRRVEVDPSLGSVLFTGSDITMRYGLPRNTRRWWVAALVVFVLLGGGLLAALPLPPIHAAVEPAVRPEKPAAPARRP